MLPTTTPSTEPHRSVTVVPALERAFSLDNNKLCMFSCKDGELRAECRKLNSEIDTSLAGLGFLPKPHHNNLRHFPTSMWFVKEHNINKEWCRPEANTKGIT